MGAYDAAWGYRLGYDDGLAAGAAAERKRLMEVVCWYCGGTSWKENKYDDWEGWRSCAGCGQTYRRATTRAEYLRLHPEGGS